jgi:NhaP-type Na+/H+ or K+/H+ antiporter
MISRTPIAAEYRAALSISYLPMLAESLLGGLIIGFLVSYCLVRFQSTLGLKEPILRALALSLIALLFVTTVIEGPARFQASHDALHWFLIGASFNALRITALGITIGYAYRRMV